MAEASLSPATPAAVRRQQRKRPTDVGPRARIRDPCEFRRCEWIRRARAGRQNALDL